MNTVKATAKVHEAMHALASTLGEGNLVAVATLSGVPCDLAAIVMRATVFVGGQYMAEDDKAYRDPAYFENGERFYAA